MERVAVASLWVEEVAVATGFGGAMDSSDEKGISAG